MSVVGHRDIEVVFPSELERRLWNYSGKWVAIVDDEIVAVGDAFAGVLGSARSASHAQPVLYKVPGPQARFY